MYYQNTTKKSANYDNYMLYGPSSARPVMVVAQPKYGVPQITMNNNIHTIQINSFNARGLRHNFKRANIFKWLKTSHAGIAMIQETHAINQIAGVWLP